MKWLFLLEVLMFFILRRRDLLLREGCLYFRIFCDWIDVGCFWQLNPLVLLVVSDTDSWLGVEIPRIIKFEID